MTEGEPAPQTRAAARSARAAAATPKRWLRAASDRVPTKWFAGIATGLFLVATAAFGGLATAPTPGLAQLTAGDEHRSDQVAITVQSAELLDANPEQGIYLEDGERVVQVRVLLENLHTAPQSAGPTGAATEALTIAELAEDADRSLRADDRTGSPTLQPRVPVEVLYRWIVADDEFHDGDLLHVTLNNLRLHIGSFVSAGEWWTDPEPAAELILRIEDSAAVTDKAVSG